MFVHKWKIFLLFMLFTSCSKNDCRKYDNQQLINIADLGVKKSAKNQNYNLVHGKYYASNIKIGKIDRTNNNYVKELVASVNYVNIATGERLFDADIYENCEIEWQFE
jgi:hypothetical protein